MDLAGDARMLDRDATGQERPTRTGPSARARRRLIAERLRSAGSIRVEDLVREFGVSPVTARRDLRILEREGAAIRRHGGATSRDLAFYEPSFRERQRACMEEKRRIARAAAALMEDARTVALTGGTTTTEVARALAGRHITIVTNAVNIAMELARDPHVRVHLTGGRLRGPSYELVGAAALHSLTGFTVDVACVGVNGVSVDRGLTTFSDEEAEVNRAMVHAARRVIVVADHTKLGVATLVQICPVYDVDVLVTDSGADPQQVTAFQAAGIRVVLA